MITKELKDKWDKEFREYSKHWPWYAKLSRGRKWQEEMCRIGNHIPVKAYDPDDEDNIEVFCQECVTDLTLDDWNKFWKGQ